MTECRISADDDVIEVVAAAVFDDRGRVLVARRPALGSHAGGWEFPGGKVEEGESPEQALARELVEELAIRVDVGQCVARSETRADARRIRLHLYSCRHREGEVRTLFHDAVRWVALDALASVAWMPSNRPLADALVTAYEEKFGFGK